MALAKAKTKSKTKHQVSEGVAHILATFNNTIITMTTVSGDVISHCSAGHVGFKNARKGTPFAAQQAAEVAAKKAVECGMRRAKVLVMGGGAGRDSAIRSLKTAGIEISSLSDVTPLPHNGCRPPKKRRV
jgi:small subunit ribosomal protein S11